MKKIGSLIVVEDKNGRSPAFYTKEKNPKITSKEIAELILESKARGNSDIRLNLHRSILSKLHQMIIIQHKGVYRRPHKHIVKEEAYQMIKGAMVLIFFDNRGNVVSHTVLNTTTCLIYRIMKDVWHVSMPLTHMVVFEETRPGPYVREKDMVYASWAPDGKNLQESNDYMKKIILQIKK